MEGLERLCEFYNIHVSLQSYTETNMSQEI